MIINIIIALGKRATNAINLSIKSLFYRRIRIV